MLAVAAGPHEAEDLPARRRGVPPRPRRAAPAWEALPYEQISPSPEVAARRAAAAAAGPLPRGPFVLVAPALAAMHAAAPTLGSVPPLVLADGLDLAPDDLAAAARRPRLRADRRGRSTAVAFAVRGGVLDVFPGRRAAPGPAGVLGRPGRVDPVVLRLDAAVHGARRRGRGRPRARADARRRRAGQGRDGSRSTRRDGSATSCDGSRTGCTPRGWRRPRRSSSTGSSHRRRSCPRDRGSSSWTHRGRWRACGAGRGRRRRPRGGDRLAGLRGSCIGLDEASLGARVRVDLTRFTEGLDLGTRSWGTAQANPSEMAKRIRELGHARARW